jgi:peptidoglycan/LPS O-acetylase OafA/YrhL
MGNATIVPRRPTGHIRADVQGLRALAVLLVMAFHAGLPLPAGFAGVDVFFVISGFVITALILRQLDAGRFSLGEFYVRRIKRLLPALILMLVVVLVLSFLLESPLGPQQTTAKTGVGAMLLVANMVILRNSGDYFDAAATTNPLAVAVYIGMLFLTGRELLRRVLAHATALRSRGTGLQHEGATAT